VASTCCCAVGVVVSTADAAAFARLVVLPRWLHVQQAAQWQGILSQAELQRVHMPDQIWGVRMQRVLVAVLRGGDFQHKSGVNLLA
jgi:uncharacterized linocin/CFP29 family protein